MTAPRPPAALSPTYYTSDSHLYHANIVNLCQRPFESESHMRTVIWGHIQAVDAAGGRLVHAGDLAFKMGATLMLERPEFRLQGAKGHVIVLGNHDTWITKPDLADGIRKRLFGTMVGTASSWKRNCFPIEDTLHGRPVRVLVSHAPQEDLGGADFNIYGHLHNGLLRKRLGITSAEHHGRFDWVEGKETHFNVGVELSHYQPQTLETLVARRAAGEFLW